MRLYIILMLLSALNIAQAQYISQVHEYKPAPGQFINALPWGSPSSAESIKGGLDGNLSLGAFGGYVIFSFEEAVENHPDNPFGVDFSIFGNAIAGLSEPGVVYVMKDENLNGEADDTWYRLAGSDDYFDGSLSGYEVTYFNPQQPEAEDVAWTDNTGRSGFVYANSFHNQPYYPLADSFPDINQEQYHLKGAFIVQPLDTSNPVMTKYPRRAFGYADNLPKGTAPFTKPDNPYTYEAENAGGDAFDISWAVDTSGNYVELNEIHFVKVQTGTMGEKPVLGEISTEITAAVDVTPDPALSGVTKMIVVRDLPNPLTEKEYQLAHIVFSEGKPAPEQEVSWKTNMQEAWVDENNVLHVNQSGDLILTASLLQDTSLKATAATSVDLQESAIVNVRSRIEMLYPNPAKDRIWMKSKGSYGFEIISNLGRTVVRKDRQIPSEAIDISKLTPGLYIIKIRMENKTKTGSFIKQ